MSRIPILTTGLQAVIAQAIDQAGGWIGFDEFMALALYAPDLGYYASGLQKFGSLPGNGSDFVTAPELSPHFGQALARQIAQALDATGTNELWEFGAGTGALAAQLLDALGPLVARYTIVDLSSGLRERQRERLAIHTGKIAWASELPARMRGVVLGNEVLDAMPVKLLVRTRQVWHERGVVVHGGRLVHADRRTALRPSIDIAGEHDYLTEIHPQAEGFIRTLSDRLEAGAAFFIDYGFPEQEYYHLQRSMGTVMCHRAHRMDPDPLDDVGDKDITAHVNFTGIALAGQEAGLDVVGYTSQGRFLLNCGLLDVLPDGADAASLVARSRAQKLVNEHEMGELFKVVGFGVPGTAAWSPIGFAAGDRSHML